MQLPGGLSAEGNQSGSQLLALPRKGVLCVGRDIRIEFLDLISQALCNGAQKRVDTPHDLLPIERRIGGCFNGERRSPTASVDTQHCA